jgi:hypothetical protein
LFVVPSSDGVEERGAVIHFAGHVRAERVLAPVVERVVDGGHRAGHRWDVRLRVVEWVWVDGGTRVERLGELHSVSG